MMSSTMNASVLRGQQTGNGATKLDGSDGAGRPEKDDAEKSDKTIANRESAGK